MWSETRSDKRHLHDCTISATVDRRDGVPVWDIPPSTVPHVQRRHVRYDSIIDCESSHPYGYPRTARAGRSPSLTTGGCINAAGPG